VDTGKSGATRSPRQPQILSHGAADRANVQAHARLIFVFNNLQDKTVTHTALELHLMWLRRLYNEQFDNQYSSNLCCRSGFGSATVKRTESE
jgi:hypothetical protein